MKKKLLCRLGFHRFRWNTFGMKVTDQFCVREGCLASRSTLTGKVYERRPLWKAELKK